MWITLSNQLKSQKQISTLRMNISAHVKLSIYTALNIFTLRDLNLNERRKNKTTCLLSKSSNWWSLTSWWFLKDLLQTGQSFFLWNQFCIQCAQYRCPQTVVEVPLNKLVHIEQTKKDLISESWKIKGILLYEEQIHLFCIYRKHIH